METVFGYPGEEHMKKVQPVWFRRDLAILRDGMIELAEETYLYPHQGIIDLRSLQIECCLQNIIRSIKKGIHLVSLLYFLNLALIARVKRV